MNIGFPQVTLGLVIFRFQLNHILKFYLCLFILLGGKVILRIFIMLGDLILGRGTGKEKK